MAETLEQPKRETLTHWQALDGKRKIAVVAIAATVFFGLIYLAVSTRSPELSPLFTNLEATDAYDIIDQLKAQGVPYELADGGRSILVPDSLKYELRLQLASEGLPQGGGVGFELFDTQGFGVTEFTQKVNYQRAIEGELARTLRAFDQVELARVMLAIPEPELYSDREKPVTASVSLKLKAGSRLSDANIQGIVHLVAASVAGLEPQNVTVVDTDGNELWAFGDSEQALRNRLTMSQLDIKRNYEAELQKKIESQLEAVVGVGNCAVRVTADMSFDQEESSSEIYQPLADNRGVVSSEQLIRESTQASTGASGVPGTASNVDGTVPTYRSADGTGGTVQTRSEDIRNYEISKTVTRVTKAPYQVNKLSVSALIHSSGLNQGQIDSLKQIISLAAGLDPARGDQIYVDTMAFAPKISQDELNAMEAEARADERRAMISSYVKAGVPVILAILAIVFSLVVFGMMRRRVYEEYAPEQVQAQLQAAVANDEDATADELSLQPETPEDRKRAQIREKIEQMARDNPQETAKLLQSWLSEE